VDQLADCVNLSIGQAQPLARPKNPNKIKHLFRLRNNVAFDPPPPRNNVANDPRTKFSTLTKFKNLPHGQPAPNAASDTPSPYTALLKVAPTPIPGVKSRVAVAQIFPLNKTYIRVRLLRATQTEQMYDTPRPIRVGAAPRHSGHAPTRPERFDSNGRVTVIQVGDTAQGALGNALRYVR